MLGIFRKLLLKLVIIISFFLASPLHIFAEEPPPGQEVGPQAERFKAGAKEEKERLEKKKAKAPEVEVKEEEEKKPEPEAISFILKEIKITGATVFKPEDFRPIYKPYLNKKVTLKDIEDIVGKIKAKYREKGYLTTIIYIPEQEIKEGIIEIRAAEGKLGKLNIEGNRYFSSSLIKKYFHTKKNEILNIKKLKRDILRLNKNPDLEVKTVISPGEERETSCVTLKVKDKFPYHIGAGIDNYGTRLVAKWRPALTFRSTNATGRGDSLFVNTLLGPRSFGESVSYALPLGSYGTKLGVDFTYFKMRLGEEYKPLEISGVTQICTPHISRELALSENFEAYLDAGIDIKSIKKKMADEITTNDQLRLPFFSFDFTKTDSFGGYNTFSPKCSFGTSNFLGASSHDHASASRAGTGGFFFKYEQFLNRIQKMPFGSYIQMRSQFQMATHTLPSSEQLQLGGANSVRGYPEGDYLADTGWNLNVDWVTPMYLIPGKWKIPGADMPLRRQIEPVIFMDLGGGGLRDTLPGERDDKFLAGIGGGFRVRFNNKFFLRLEWAERLGDRPTSGSGPSTFYLTFQSDI